MPHKGSQGAPLSHHTDGSFKSGKPTERSQHPPTVVPFVDVGDSRQRSTSYSGGGVSGGQGADKSRSG